MNPPRALQRQPARYQVGTFVKTASPHVVEVLGTTALDFAVLDAEHAPLDRAAIDLMMLAGRAAGLPLLVRVPDTAAATVLSVLDTGAAGLLVPHVDTPEIAAQVVRRARFRGGERGYSSSPRWAGYGSLGMKQALAAGDDALVVCQIESPEAVAHAAQIAAVPGVDDGEVQRGGAQHLDHVRRRGLHEGADLVARGLALQRAVAVHRGGSSRGASAPAGWGPAAAAGAAPPGGACSTGRSKIRPRAA